jgi:epoxyqueuosine reductase
MDRFERRSTLSTWEKARWVTSRARELGFDLCGVAPAEKFPELEHLPEWLARGYAGEMRYLHDPRRASPALAMPGARSIIVCAMNYNTPLPYSTECSAGLQASLSQPDKAPSLPPDPYSLTPSTWISRYAWGDDYHNILGDKLDALVAAMRAEFAQPFEARAYVDTGPVAERVAAKWAGLGWLGKNTCLINEHLGSWLFLGVILTTLDLLPSLAEPNDSASAESPLNPANQLATRHSPLATPLTPDPRPLTPSPDLCGHCTQCIDACPTGALIEPYVLDARRCISYLTIELRGEIPEEFHTAIGWHVFGCDICQDVCPFNRKAPVTAEPRFLPRQIETRNSKLETRGDVGAAFKPPSGPDVAATLRSPSEDVTARFCPPSDSASSLTPRPHPQIPLEFSSLATRTPGASPHSPLSLFAPPLDWLASLTESDFRAIFRASAIRRTKHSGLLRNARLALANTRRTGVSSSPPENPHP